MHTHTHTYAHPYTHTIHSLSHTCTTHYTHTHTQYTLRTHTHTLHTHTHTHYTPHTTHTYWSACTLTYIDISGAAIHQLLSSIARGNSEVRELLSFWEDFQPGHCQEV